MNLKLRECRLEAGMSQKYVALSLGLAGPSVSNWESGKTVPALENLISIADLYGVTLDRLAGRDDHEFTVSKIERFEQEKQSLSEDEKGLLSDFRVCDRDGKIAILAAAVVQKQRTVSAEATDEYVG